MDTKANPAPPTDAYNLLRRLGGLAYQLRATARAGTAKCPSRAVHQRLSGQPSPSWTYVCVGELSQGECRLAVDPF